MGPIEKMDAGDIQYKLRKRGWRGLILRGEDFILNLLKFMGDSCEVIGG